jgi:hypothetical protein
MLWEVSSRHRLAKLAVRVSSPSSITKIPSSPLVPSSTRLRLYQVTCLTHSPHFISYHSYSSLQLSRSFTSTSPSNMAPVDRPQHERYDYICIGGGSGGVASSVRAHSGVCATLASILPLASCGLVRQESCPCRRLASPRRYMC